MLMSFAIPCAAFKAMLRRALKLRVPSCADEAVEIISQFRGFLLALMVWKMVRMMSLTGCNQ